MKKILATVLLVITLSSSANAIVAGLVPGAVGAIASTAGSLVFLVGGVGALVGAIENNGGQVSNGLSLALLGLIILDEKGQSATLNYPVIDAQLAAKIGATEQEVATFNAERDQVNSIANTIFASTVESLKNGATKEQAATQVGALWDSYSGSLSPETYSTVKKFALQK